MKALPLSVPFICGCLTAALAQAQVRTVEVGGHQMQVRTSGIENPGPGTPVVVFEAGNGGSLTTWDSVFEDVAEFAAAVAYDRAGLGAGLFARVR